jgi:serine/threonine-protein kinase
MLLLSGGVKILDFGLAKMQDLSLSGGTLLGTVGYMSPEQVRGDAVEGRTDLWSLGVVLYEMLTGRRPFLGEHEISLAHAIVHEEPVPPSMLRREIPPPVEEVILRLLSKEPAGRHETAAELDAGLAAVQLGQALLTRARPRGREALTRWQGAGPVAKVVVALAAATGLLGVLLAVALVGSRRPPTARLDPNLIAVFPFRVVSSETSHGALREGMVDILEAMFSGAGGPRVVPARTALAAWRRARGARREEMTEEEARGVARELGAGAVVLGTVVGMSGRLILNGSLLDAESGRVRAEAKTEGRRDSLHSLVDRFAAQLAALGAGEPADHLASLTSTSLPALYAYLAGKADHRAGRYSAAVRHFELALELDSTFARAALGYWASAAWDADPAGMRRGVRLALTHRDRLGPRDRVLLAALAGPWDSGGPGPRERIEAWEHAVRQVPDDPELWIQLGDAYFHVGAAAGVEEPFRRAVEALNRALALDTTLSLEPIDHLLSIAAMERDTAAVRRLVSRIPKDDPSTAKYRLEAGAVLGDSAILAVARAQFDSAGSVGLMRWLLLDVRSFGFAIQEAERVVARYLERSRYRPSGVFPILDVYAFYHELGRPAAAAAALAPLGPDGVATPVVSRMILSQALYGYVDSAAAAEALVRLGTFTKGPVARDSAAREEQDRSICVMERWRLTRGDTRTARAAIGRLAAGGAWGCRVVLEAQLAAAEHRPDAEAAFNRLDSLFLAGGGRPEWVIEVARWREADGDVAAALRTSRQCRQYAQFQNLSYCLREEGRLATLAGDRTGAIEAYRHYLELRFNPEPSVRPEVDRVRAMLARLVSGSE